MGYKEHFLKQVTMSKDYASNVYTVQHVKRMTYDYEKPEDTSKTDDEKLIELLTRDKI
jgi:hypothetical protein